MSLLNLLTKYKQLPIVDRVINIINGPIVGYLTIKKQAIDNKLHYVVEGTKEFSNLTGVPSTNIILDHKLNLVKAECGCLEHYRKKECVHEALLYAITLKAINPQEFEKQLLAYKRSILVAEHEVLLNNLSNELRTSSSYFNKIHLCAEINNEGGNYYLSLHISYDKEYVVKSISEFIDNMENNKYYTYGQKLAFVHSYEVLDDESKEFYSFLSNISNEETQKSLQIKRSQFLRLLEIFHNSGIYYSVDGGKSIFYNIVDVEKIDIVLDHRCLYLNRPEGSKKLTCGINYAYFIGDDKIYSYRFKRRNEAIIFSTLFKSKIKGLIIDAHETNFISNLLPVLKQEILIEDSFYQKYSLPTVIIKSYFLYQLGNIVNNFKLEVEEKYRNTPYVEQVLEGYFRTLEGMGFIKDKTGNYVLETVENQYAFLTSDISSLKSYGEVFFDESVKKITIKKSNKVNVAISYNIGLLDFKFEPGNMTIEEVQAMLSAYREKKKFVKLKNDVIIDIVEEDVRNLDNFLEDFNIEIDMLDKEIAKPINYLLKIVGAKDDSIIYDDKVCEMIDEIQSYKEVDVKIGHQFENVLRPYQLEAFKWLKMLSKFGFGGILADDMGLGKTLEIISFLESDKIQAPTMIVCPMSLVYNWENECRKWHFVTPINLVLGGAPEREEIINNIDYNKKAIYITSYDSLRRDIELYKGTFRYVIADEAQYIKNQNALKSTAIKQLKSTMNFALTGTPIENGLSDLWSIFDYLMPGYLADYNHFKSRYESLITHSDFEALDLLKKRVQPFILRRTKKDVLKDLPDKLEQVYYCKMDGKQEEIYKTYVEDIKQDLNGNGKQILALITRLRQICITPELIYDEPFTSSKLALALELINRAISSNHRILVFSQFASVFPILAKMLDEQGIKHLTLDGTTKAMKRMELVDEFNNNSDNKVFMISLKAGGTGLNLVGADMVIHLDPWWNISAENQATDRAYRIGQTKNVSVLKLVCKGTIEEKVLQLQKAKRELADSVIQSENKNVNLTRQEILQLLE